VPDIRCRLEFERRWHFAAPSRVVAAHGRPRTIKIDNRNEFVSKATDRWTCEHGGEFDCSRPGKPTDNAKVESFNGRLRAEYPSTYWFLRLAAAQRKIAAWREYKMEGRPRSTWGWTTPAEFTRQSEVSAQSAFVTQPGVSNSHRY
jgi:putative transposase